MKRQTSIYLSDLDFKKLEKIKEVYQLDSNGAAIQMLISAENERIIKYENLNI